MAGKRWEERAQYGFVDAERVIRIKRLTFIEREKERKREEERYIARHTVDARGSLKTKEGEHTRKERQRANERHTKRETSDNYSTAEIDR